MVHLDRGSGEGNRGNRSMGRGWLGLVAVAPLIISSPFSGFRLVSLLPPKWPIDAIHKPCRATILLRL